MRLVIDLPNTGMSVADKLVPVNNPDLGTLHLTRFDITPPMVRIDIAFHRPLAYSWDSTGNRLVVSFHEISEKDTSPGPAARASSGISPAAANPQPVSSPAEAGDFTNVVPAERLTSGAAITADSETTVLRLKRAGDVYVCPRTTVSVVHSKNGPDLMLALNGGGLETHLNLQDSMDEVVTPDFRILLRGPGEFDYAIHADSRGNTCVRTLPGNTASAIIYELMGDGEYQVQKRDQFVFHDGKYNPAISHADLSVLPVDCGCPPPARQTLLTASVPETQIVPGDSSPNGAVRGDDHSETDSTPEANHAPQGFAPSDAALQVPNLPESVRNQPHVQIEASLAFTPNLANEAARRLPATSRRMQSPIAALPPLKYPERHKGVFGKIKTFFSRVF